MVTSRRKESLKTVSANIRFKSNKWKCHFFMLYYYLNLMFVAMHTRTPIAIELAPALVGMKFMPALISPPPPVGE